MSPEVEIVAPPAQRPKGVRLLPAGPHVASLDFVRLIAALTVAWYHFAGMAVQRMHAAGSIPDSQVWLSEHPGAVQWHFFAGGLTLRLFMMLSAFSLTLQALGSERLSPGPWWRARLRRIFPSLWLCGALLTLVALATTGRPPVPWDDVLWNVLGLTSLAWVDPLDGSWWFIGLILSFYVTFPLFLAFARRGLSLVLLVLATVVAVESQARWDVPLQAVFHNPYSEFVGSRMMEFAFGVALAELVHRRGRAVFERLRSWPVLAAVLVLTVLAVDRWAIAHPRAPHGPLAGFLVLLSMIGVGERLPAPLLRLGSRLAGPTLVYYLLHQRLFGTAIVLFDGLGLRWAIPVHVLFACLLFAVSIPLHALAESLGQRLFALAEPPPEERPPHDHLERAA